jgi:hypothetical protein
MTAGFANVSGEFANVRGDMATEFANVRAEMTASSANAHGEFTAIRVEMATEFAAVHARFAEMDLKMATQLRTTVVTHVGTMVGLAAFMAAIT